MGDCRDAEPRPPTPAWVKVFAVAAIMVVLAILVLLLLGGEHGPGRHAWPSSILGPLLIGWT